MTLSTQDNVKLLEKLNSGFKKTINWNKYQSKESIDARNLNILDDLVDPSFQGVDRLFVLCFENTEDRATHTHRVLFSFKNKRLQCSDRWTKSVLIN